MMEFQLRLTQIATSKMMLRQKSVPRANKIFKNLNKIWCINNMCGDDGGG